MVAHTCPQCRGELNADHRCPHPPPLPPRAEEKAINTVTVLTNKSGRRQTVWLNGAEVPDVRDLEIDTAGGFVTMRITAKVVMQ